MRLFATVVMAASVAAGAAFAAPPRVSDNDYLRMARCAGLADGSGADATALNNALAQANEGRGRVVKDSANVRRRSAAQQIRGARGDFRTQLETELATRCAVTAG